MTTPDRSKPKVRPQAGILNRPPEHVLLAAYDLQTSGAEPVTAVLDQLRALLQHELRSELDPLPYDAPKEQPSAETGELGFTDHYDRYHLTITVGFGSGAYDKLGTPSDLRPKDVRPIPWGDLGDARSDGSAPSANGDLLLQVCTDSLYIGEHVLRRVEHEMRSQLTPVWSVVGHQRHTSRAGRTNRHEGRALIGFVDGSSNLNPRDDADDARLVFVDPDAWQSYPPKQPAVDPAVPNQYAPDQPPAQFPELHDPPVEEPQWIRGGSYMVVRASTFNSAEWDQRSLGDQEAAVGRFKLSGQPLDADNDPNVPLVPPRFGDDPNNTGVPFTAHIRKANPRRPEDADRRIFRRGYPLIATEGAELRRGLIFIAFGRTITTQFEFITRAWTANPDFPHALAGTDPLRAIETVLCGGYFFVPPLTNAKPWSFALPPAEQAAAPLEVPAAVASEIAQPVPPVVETAE